MSDTAIAVVGVGCRFPDARTPEQFWSNIDNGVISMRELPNEVLRASGVDESVLRGEDYVRVGTLLPGAAEFAAEFFGYTPREAELIDPQQRVFLETAWEALERAGHSTSVDKHAVGVFTGTGAGPYHAALFAAKARAEGVSAAVGDLDLTLGGEVDFMPSRTAYKLGLRGPALSVQTGCSSSLYALHYASLSLLAGECDIALAGGSAVQEPLLGYRHKPGRALSEDGQCRSFDHRSSGTNHGSGVGVLVLRLLSDALADGDTVLAVLHGSAVGNDGSDKLGYVAPSTAGITRVVSKAMRVAGVRAEDLRYVEAHGTATPLGDQVELAALTDAFRETTDATGYCRLGSVMSNIGHTGPNAGMAGFIKAVNIARTGVLPPHPSFERARQPGVLAESPFTIATEPGRTDDQCFVLVNSVGMGGSNAAAVLGPPPAPTRPAAPVGEKVRLVLSARARTELDALSRQVADHIAAGEVAVADLAHTLRVGRKHFDERRVVTAAPDRLAAALRLPRPPLVKTQRSTSRRAAIVAAEGAVPADVLDLLRSALPADTPVAADSAAVPADRFTVLIGAGEPGANRHLFDTAAADPRDEVEAALAEAWLNGVAVDWARLSPGVGRRVPAPTYPFTRQRHWALDRISLAPGGDVAAAARVDESTGDDVEVALLKVWRDLFGKPEIGLDDQFGALGGTSLLAMQLALEIQDRLGTPVNVHRAGGSRVTVRRLAELVRAQREGSEDVDMGDGLDRGDDELIDADVALPLGELSTTRSRGKDFLLTGASGYLGAFLLHELQQRTKGKVYCIVRAADEKTGMERLRAAARKFMLPEPDAERVRAVPGDLRDIAKVAAHYRDGELERTVGHILHCAAKVVFTEPYRTLREDNVLPMADLIAWARGRGVRDFSYVSSLAAAGPAMGAGARYLETREQALDPESGSYGVSKWVCERLLARAEEDGMRVRVFRPGLIMAASGTGAGNDKDLIYFTLISGLAVGAHPEDDRVLVMSPVDMVSRGIVDLALSPGAVGRAYHLVAERAISMRNLFLQLANAGFPTERLPLKQWQDKVKALALETGNPILSAAALLELEGHDRDELAVQAAGWQPWLARNGLDPALTGAVLRRGIEYLAQRDDLVRDLVGHLVTADAESGN
ncbi:thioester reductase domain-containing protein [Actinokineospora sp. G85]|uniref:thioester reductase domain-containing protein n=1 Tax=Actinokineospora sp. G85 TaxID=3406626 RepID=UPI003C7706EA